MENSQLSRRNFLRNVGGLVAVASLPFLSGCEHTEQEYSQILHEDAKVVQTVYTPSRHGSGTTVNFNSDDEGNINPGFGVTSIDIPEKYAVVFKCQHGKFIVEGTDSQHKALWKRMNEGDIVDVTYKEVYQTRYNNQDGKKNILEKRLIDYDFIDAQPKSSSKAEKE
jgi:hypothetical protein